MRVLFDFLVRGSFWIAECLVTDFLVALCSLACLRVLACVRVRVSSSRFDILDSV